MADVKISELPTKTVAGTDMIPVVDAGATTTSRVTAADIAGIATAGLATVATSGSYNDLTDKPAAGISLGTIWALS
jgi:hypothetical protein